MKENNSKYKFYVICDNLGSSGNIGSIFRTSDALGVDKIFLCGICGQPPHQKISKTALGAENNIPWEFHRQAWRIIDRLKKEGVAIIALEQTAESICYTDFKHKFPLALIVGNEITGISRSVLQRANYIIHLPMLGKKESLNVSVAFGIAGYWVRINK